MLMANKKLASINDAPKKKKTDVVSDVAKKHNAKAKSESKVRKVQEAELESVMADAFSDNGPATPPVMVKEKKTKKMKGVDDKGTPDFVPKPDDGKEESHPNKPKGKLEFPDEEPEKKSKAKSKAEKVRMGRYSHNPKDASRMSYTPTDKKNPDEYPATDFQPAILRSVIINELVGGGLSVCNTNAVYHTAGEEPMLKSSVHDYESLGDALIMAKGFLLANRRVIQRSEAKSVKAEVARIKKNKIVGEQLGLFETL